MDVRTDCNARVTESYVLRIGGDGARGPLGNCTRGRSAVASKVSARFLVIFNQGIMAKAPHFAYFKCFEWSLGLSSCCC